MKKIIALLMALMMLLSFVTLVSAEGTLHSSDEVDVQLTLVDYTFTSTNAGTKKNNTFNKLVDRKISAPGEPTNTYKTYLNYSLVSGKGDSITIYLSAEEAVAFSGVRFYTRRNDNDYTKIVPGDNVQTFYVSVSEDGKNYVKSDLLTTTASGTQEGYENNRWYQANVKFDGSDVSVSGAKYIKIDVMSNNSSHFGAEEITLLTPNGENTKSIYEINASHFINKAAELDSYLVNGGLERKAIIAELDQMYALFTEEQKASDNLSAAVDKYITAKTRYNEARHEVDTTGKMTASAVAYNGDGTMKSTLAASKLTDGITKEGTRGKVNGQDTFCRGDFCVDPSDTTNVKQDGRHILITLTLDPTVEFSGIRSYTGKYDDNTTSTSWFTATKVLVKLYDEEGNIVSFGNIKPIYAKTANGERANSYVDYVLENNKVEFSATGASKVEFDILRLDGKEQHWRAEEIRLLEAKDTAKTVADLKNELLSQEAQPAVDAINAIDTRVTGSVEVKKGIEAAKAAYAALSDEAKTAVANYGTLTEIESAYNASDVKEIEAVLTGSAKSDHINSHDHSDLGYNNGGNADGVYSTTNLFDNKISAEAVLGKNSAFMRGDYSVFGKANEYLHITINTEGVESFSGIRIYNRKGDNVTTYDKGNIPSKVKVALYSGETYVTSGIIATTVMTGNNGKQNMYYDIPLTFNGENVKFTGITKIVLTLTEMNGDNKWGSFGAEELRLLDDETITAEKTVSDVAKTLVTISTPTFESGVFNDGNGIIRFFTSFENIAEGAEIEYFGTYAIENGKEAFDGTTNSNCAVYTVGEDVTGQPVAKNSWSADIEGISETYFSTPVYALSFVKLKGYDNLILSGVLKDAKVDSENILK